MPLKFDASPPSETMPEQLTLITPPPDQAPVYAVEAPPAGEMFSGPAPALTVMSPAKFEVPESVSGAAARLDQSARLRAAVEVHRPAAVDRAGDDRIARPVEGQIADDGMQRPVDGQRLSAGHGPRLRPADIDLRVDGRALVGLDAAGGDGDRPAAERVAGRAGVERHAMGDDGAVYGDGPVAAGVVENGLEFLVDPGERVPVELFAQFPLVPEFVSQTALVVPFQVFVAAIPA